MRVRDLGVWLDGDHIATLHSPAIGRIVCRYADHVLSTVDRNAPLLSCSIPVRQGKNDAWAFCAGLLPEGRHREAMAAQAGVPSFDVMGMLARFGRDVAGAVVIGTQPPSEREPSVAAYSEEDLVDAVQGLDERSLALEDDSELSIAGLQDKMLLVKLDGDRWGRPVRGYPSTHILKVDDRFHRGLVRAEHACLSLASAAGIAAAGSELITIGDTECIFVRRFDRAPSASGEPRRIHQEDACQALGIDPERNARRAKYETHGGPSLESIARLLTAWASQPRSALLALLDTMTFTVAIGNADAHGKNVALLHPGPGRIDLAPVYDCVPTALWPSLRCETAMSIAGRYRLPDITVNDLIVEATRWSLPAPTAERRIRETLSRMQNVMAEGRIDVDTPAMPLIARRVDRLLRTH
jgi:serine/threonine-protein kinase HipA